MEERVCVCARTLTLNGDEDLQQTGLAGPSLCALWTTSRDIFIIDSYWISNVILAYGIFQRLFKMSED